MLHWFKDKNMWGNFFQYFYDKTIERLQFLVYWIKDTDFPVLNSGKAPLKSPQFRPSAFPIFDDEQSVYNNN